MRSARMSILTAGMALAIAACQQKAPDPSISPEAEAALARINAQYEADRILARADDVASSSAPTPVVTKPAPSTPIPAAEAERCWQDYCPCDEEAAMDKILCRNMRGGVEVTDEMMASAAAMRDARAEMDKFEAENDR